MSRAFLGIDIGGTNTKLAVLDARGELVSRGIVETRPQQGPEALFKRIDEAVPGLAGHRELAAAGIGCAGLIESRRGIVHSSPNLPTFVGVRISRIASRVLGVYTCIENDANAAAYGEYTRGSGGNSQMFLCVTLGTGVGGGIVANGDILRGAGGFAGEIGHTTINERGPRCTCGNRGCLEAYVGAGRLTRRARAMMRKFPRSLLHAEEDELTPEVITRAARRGDAAALAVMDEAAEHLGTALASAVNLLNPDRIALGGGVAGGFDVMRKRIVATVTERAFPESARGVRIGKAKLGNTAASIGMAVIALRRWKESR